MVIIWADTPMKFAHNAKRTIVKVKTNLNREYNKHSIMKHTYLVKHQMQNIPGKPIDVLIATCM